jgi:hypothetical protein
MIEVRNVSDFLREVSWKSVTCHTLAFGDIFSLVSSLYTVHIETWWNPCFRLFSKEF